MNKKVIDMMVNQIILIQKDIILSIGKEAYIQRHLLQFDDYMDEYMPEESNECREDVKKDIRNALEVAIDKQFFLLTPNLN